MKKLDLGYNHISDIGHAALQKAQVTHQSDVFSFPLVCISVCLRWCQSCRVVERRNKTSQHLLCYGINCWAFLDGAQYFRSCARRVWHKSDAAFNSRLLLIFAWACAPSVVHVNALFQQLVLSVSTSSCHPIHAERFIFQAAEKTSTFSIVFWPNTWQLEKRQKQKAVHPVPVASSRRTCLKSARTSRVASSPTAVQQDSIVNMFEVLRTWFATNTCTCFSLAKVFPVLPPPYHQSHNCVCRYPLERDSIGQRDRSWYFTRSFWMGL